MESRKKESSVKDKGPVAAVSASNPAAGDNNQRDEKKPKKFFTNNRSNNRRYFAGKNRYGNRYGGSGDNRRFKRPRFEVGERLKETDLGITEYVSSCEGFTATMKERFTDFQVHEIDVNGVIAQLTSHEVPEEPNLPNLEELKKKIPEDVWTQLQEISIDNTSVEIDVTDLTKEQRKSAHTVIKTLNTVVSETKDVMGRKVMVFYKPFSKTGDPRTSQDNREDWSARGGDYCYFILHKVNIDTMDTLNQMAKVLRMKASMFGYAGTKDRRARTTQWISIKKMNPKKIIYAARTVRGAHVGNFKYQKEPLKLGKLEGNRFSIALRNVTASDEVLEAAMVSLRDNGFINYYGLQRFGTISTIPTYEIGKAILQGNWAEAIDLILKPREGEQDYRLAEARKIYQKTKDARAAYEKLGRVDKIEANLLWGLNICGQKNPQGALDMIPRNTLLMYIHAYQSFVWNTMVSRRIKQLGLKPVVGDLVYEDPETEIKDDEVILEAAEEKKEDEVSEASEASGSESADKVEHKGKKTEESKKTEKEERPLPKVKVLTQKELSKYKITDVILPLPGWKVEYPTYAKEWYEEFLEKDGLTTELKQKNKKYSLGGSYRKIVQIPSNLSWNVLHYLNKADDLIATDIDEMKGLKAPPNNPEGKFKALILQMSLKSSSYATMALREIMKCDTSAQFHAAQTAAFHEGEAKVNAEGQSDNSSKNDNVELDGIHVEDLKLQEKHNEKCNAIDGSEEVSQKNHTEGIMNDSGIESGHAIQGH